MIGRDGVHHAQLGRSAAQGYQHGVQLVGDRGQGVGQPQQAVRFEVSGVLGLVQKPQHHLTGQGIDLPR